MSFLYDKTGKRKYLTIDERRAFLRAVERTTPEVHTFCATLAYTGARISEVLALTPEHIDHSENMVIIECAKKRRKGVFRAIPIPRELVDCLITIHHVSEACNNPQRSGQRIWPWCRTTAWKHVKAEMKAAGISGKHASPRGLRHSFGVSAIQAGLPLNMVRKWLGHARLSTTEIYTDAIGCEERDIAKQFWTTFEG